MHIDQVTALRPTLPLGSSRRGLLSGLVATLLETDTRDLAAKRKHKSKRKRKKSSKKDRAQDLPQIRVDAQCAGANGAAVDGLPDGRIAQTFTAT